MVATCCNANTGRYEIGSGQSSQDMFAPRTRYEKAFDCIKDKVEALTADAAADEQLALVTGRRVQGCCLTQAALSGMLDMEGVFDNIRLRTKDVCHAIRRPCYLAYSVVCFQDWPKTFMDRWLSQRGASRRICKLHISPPLS